MLTKTATGFVLVAGLEGSLLLDNEVFAQYVPKHGGTPGNDSSCFDSYYEHEPPRSARVSELWASYFSFIRMVAESASP